MGEDDEIFDSDNLEDGLDFTDTEEELEEDPDFTNEEDEMELNDLEDGEMMEEDEEDVDEEEESEGEEEENDITSYRTTREIFESGLFSVEERRREYRRRGKSPSGFIDGVYNDFQLDEGEMYNDSNRDWDADA